MWTPTTIFWRSRLTTICTEVDLPVDWSHSPYVVVIVSKFRLPKAHPDVAINSAVTAAGRRTSRTSTRPHFQTFAGICCFHGARCPTTTSTPSSTAHNDDDGDDDDQTADNDDDDDCHLRWRCAGYILDAEYVVRIRISTNKGLSCIVKRNLLLFEHKLHQTLQPPRDILQVFCYNDDIVSVDHYHHHRDIFNGKLTKCNSVG